ncbi:MAG: tricarballylate utilization 4Fe-4S protein TcuB [Candidatus Dormibacteraceae bacterium]
MPLTDLLGEAERQLNVCNSCRYCEGYCAVFPALERRLSLKPGDVTYLANLCHDCRACLQACMYSPPHELAVDIPAALTAVREADYQRYAWPGPLAVAFRNAWGAAVLATLIGVVATLLAVWRSGGFDRFFSATSEPGSFYRIVRYEFLVVPGLLLSAYILVIFAVGFVRFWRDARTGPAEGAGVRAVALAAGEALTLRWQAGGGPGCYYPSQRAPSRSRRILHVAMVLGFGSAFAATGLAALFQDVFGWPPPYPLLSAPVLLGSAGGIAMIAGTSGLIYLKLRAEPAGSEPMRALDLAFLVLLNLASITGMLLLALRDSSLLGTMLSIHLAVLFGLYLTAPYGKMIHLVYRFGALVKNRMEIAAEAA